MFAIYARIRHILFSEKIILGVISSRVLQRKVVPSSRLVSQGQICGATPKKMK